MNPIAIRRSTILVMHRDPLLCAGLATALRRHAAFEVFASDEDTGDSDMPPIDVVIADYPDAMRLAATRSGEPRRSLVAARIMSLTSNDREADIRRALEAGIHGYLLLGGPIDELIEGVSSVAKGVRFLCRSVAQRMADSLTRATMTSRESDVLRLVMIGESNKAIARQLQIEVGTVKSHMSAIMTKLGAASRTQAASIAASRGLVEERGPTLSPAPTLPVCFTESRESPAHGFRWNRVEARA